MVCKFWYPHADPWGRVMCDWTIGNNKFSAKHGNQVKHGNNHSVQLPSMKIWNTTVVTTCAIARTHKVISWLGKKFNFHNMTTYYDTIPIYVQHNDLQWDISELVNNHYPIQNDNWEISDLRVLFLKENSSFDSRL